MTENDHVVSNLLRRVGHRLNASGGFVESKRGASADHPLRRQTDMRDEDIGSGFGEPDGHRLADAAAGAGDESGFSVELELIEDGHACTFTRIFMQSPPRSI